MWVMSLDPGMTPSEARVLRALLRVEAPVSGRALARIAGLTQSTVQRALARLRRAGLVVAEPAPPALLYLANLEHLAMPALRTLLQLEGELRERTTEHVGEWRLPPVSLVVYGSVARGQATASSDLDLLVVRPDGTEPDEAAWQHQLAELTNRAQQWTGRRVSMVEMSRREAAQGLADREPFLVEADRDGWLIAGRPLGELATDGT